MVFFKKPRLTSVLVDFLGQPLNAGITCMSHSAQGMRWMSEMTYKENGEWFPLGEWKAASEMSRVPFHIVLFVLWYADWHFWGSCPGKGWLTEFFWSIISSCIGLFVDPWTWQMSTWGLCSCVCHYHPQPVSLEKHRTFIRHDLCGEQGAWGPHLASLWLE